MKPLTKIETGKSGDGISFVNTTKKPSETLKERLKSYNNEINLSVKNVRKGRSISNEQVINYINTW